MKVKQMTDQDGPRKKPNLAEKAKSFAQAMASRGLTNKKTSDKTKVLRHLSCHGDDQLEPCPGRENSKKFPGSKYCGECGCGDKELTQLVDRIEVDKHGNEHVRYGKLDFPKVSCPRQMPGFVNFTISAESPDPRKQKIEERVGIEEIKKLSQ
jgi:hypothetical protein